MKIKLFVAREIQYFELGIFSFNSYVYYLTRGFIASTRAFNLLTRAFNLPTRAFNLPTRAFNLATRAFSLLTRGFELVTRGFELVTRRFELATSVFELVTCVLLFYFQNSYFFAVDYTIFQKVKSKNGGGLILYVNESIPVYTTSYHFNSVSQTKNGS